MRTRRADDVNFLAFLAVVAAMLVIVLFAAKAFTAPVPTHLMPTPPADVCVGYRWHYCGDVLRVDWIEDGWVGFVNETRPEVHWSGCRGINVQTVRQTMAEAAQYGQPLGWHLRLPFREN